MPTEVLKPAAICVIGAFIGAASMHIVLQSGVVGDSRPLVPLAGTVLPAGLDASNPSDEGPEARASFAQEATPDATDAEDGRPRSGADALVDLANDNPRAAMNRALALETYWLRLDTAERIASVWATQAPNAALAYLQASLDLDPEAKRKVRARMLVAWATSDPGRALDYLVSRDGQNLFFLDPDTARKFVRKIADAQPRGVLAASNPLARGIVRNELRDAAIAALVEQDLAFAVRQAALAAPGTDQREWVRSIAGPYAQAEPEKALAWAADVEAAVPGTVNRVAHLVHEAHPDRTEELGLCDRDPSVDPGCR